MSLGCATCGVIEYMAVSPIVESEPPRFSLCCAKCGALMMPLGLGKEAAESAATLEVVAHAPPVGDPARVRFIEARLANLVTSSIRRKLLEVQAGLVKCDDPMCAKETRKLFPRQGGTACTAPNCKGKVGLVCDVAAGHTWLEYLACLLDVERVKKACTKAGKPKPEHRPDAEAVYACALKEVKRFLASSDYHIVKLESLMMDYVRETNRKFSIPVEAVATPAKTDRKRKGAAGAGGEGEGGKRVKQEVGVDALFDAL